MSSISRVYLNRHTYRCDVETSSSVSSQQPSWSFKSSKGSQWVSLQKKTCIYLTKRMYPLEEDVSSTRGCRHIPLLASEFQGAETCVSYFSHPSFIHRPELCLACKSPGQPWMATVCPFLGPELWTASWLGRTEKVQQLIEAGEADVEATGGPRQSTPLRSASYRGNLEVVKLLIAHGANVSARDSLGATSTPKP